MVPLSSIDTAKHKNVTVCLYVLRKMFLVCLLALGFVPFLHAQTYYSASSAGASPNNKPGSPVGSYAISDFESVNPYSGKLNFSLPLASVGGRGNATFTMALKLQKNWSIRHDVYDPNIYLPGSETYPILHNYYPIDYEYGSNIDIIAGPGIMKATQAGTNRSYFMCGTQPCYDETLTRLTFERSDGSVMEFRDMLHGGKAIRIFDAFYRASRGTHWVSTDGSNATFMSDSTIYDYQLKGAGSSVYFPSGTLYLPDGTKYVIVDGSVRVIVDVNGNKVSRASAWTDSLGREIHLIENRNPTTYELYDKTITFKGTNGANRTIKLDYASLESRLTTDCGIDNPPNGLFPLPPPEYPGGEFSFNPGVVESVELPDARKYEFKYNCYGELGEVKLPTGGRIEYIWQPPGSGLYQYYGWEGNTYEVYRRVAIRRVYENEVLQSETQYGFPDHQDYSVTVGTYRNNEGTLELVNRIKHYYADSPIPGWHPIRRPTEEPHWMSGKELRTEVYDGNGTLLRKTENVWEPGFPLAANPGAAINHRISQVTETLADANLVSKKNYSYDGFNNRTDVYEYDYGTGAPGALLRRSHTDYVTDTNYTLYTGAHLRSLLLQTWVSGDINGTAKASLTQFEYDNYAADSNHAALVARSNVFGHDSVNYGITNTRRGNVTAVTTYANAPAQTGAISAYSQFDLLGNVVKTIDANGNASTISYNDNFGAPDGEATTNTPPTQLNGLSTFAFPTGTTNPMNWTGQVQYDYFTGSPVNARDMNGVISKTLYSDPLDRPTQSVTAVGTALESQSNIVYDDANRRIETKSDLNVLNDNLLKSESFYDGLGRTFETRSYRDGGYVVSKTEFDAMGRVKRVTNPYRPHLNETVFWTESFYDALGRVTKTKTPDNAEVNTSYSGNAVTVTDQAGRQRRNISNALGQLIRVDEPNNAGELGGVTAPNQPTYYFYDALGKMVHVQQDIQHRWFMHDSLGRMIRVRQPEQTVNAALNTTGNPGNNSWTAAFTYDNNGNVLAATDAKDITVTNTYDALNRALTRTYEDGTPAVVFTYDDSAIPLSKGKLTKVASSVSESRYTQFDLLGRTKQFKQITDGQTYTSSYEYNLSGALIKETYPSGREVRNEFDVSGDISRIFGKATPTATERTYANTFSYTADGRIEKLRLGNGLWEAAKFNNRLQVTEFALGRGVASGDVWKNNYEFGELQTNGTVDATKNSGNIAKQTATFSGLANPFVQTYKYDSLYRLTEAKETNNGNQTWRQAFTYDRYGNRLTHQKFIGTTQLNLSVAEHPAINPADNRFTTGQGFTFDANGNMIVDADGRQFTFNGDNKQTEVKDAANNVVGRYWYDGEGKRIKKITNTETTVFVYSGSKLIAEYSTATPPSNPTTSYTVTDQLGSPRVIVNALGEVVSRRDFMPFGEEIAPDGTYRTTGRKYGTPDSVRQKFTGYLKDEETGLDFAEARMYQNLHGRFTAVDPLLASGKSNNPQTFNRYVYVMNAPLKHSDPTGLQAAERVQNVYPCGRGAACDYTVSGNVLKVNTRELASAEVRADNSPLQPVSTETEISNVIGTHPLENPQGYINEQVARGIESGVNQARDAAYDVAPDYGKFSVGFASVSLEVTMSKDFRFYGGLNVTSNPFAEDGNGGFNAKPVPQFSVGYFVNGVNSEESRHRALAGPNASASVPLTPLLPLGVGINKSVPDAPNVSILSTPTAVEIGTPSAGAGFGASGEILPSVRDFIRRRFGRPPVEENQ